MASGFLPCSFFAPDSLAFGHGLLLGDDSAFSSGLAECVRELGISHLAAASGANLAFVATAVAIFSRKLRFSVQKMGEVLAIIFYCLLIGWSGSLWRAFLMWSYVFAGKHVFGRPVHPGIVLAFALLGTKLLWPAWFLSKGFWLSYSAVVGITISQALNSRENKNDESSRSLFTGIIAALRIGWWVWVCVAVWIWWWFHEIDSLGILNTLVVGLVVEPYVWAMAFYELTSRLSPQSIVAVFAAIAVTTFYKVITVLFQFLRAVMVSHPWSDFLRFALYGFGAVETARAFRVVWWRLWGSTKNGRFVGG